MAGSRARRRLPRVPRRGTPPAARRSFAVVDAAYTNAFHATRRWLTDQPCVDEVAVAAHLRDLMGDATTTAQMTTVVRGAQAACFVADWLVQVDLIRLLAADDATLRAAGDDPATWRTLRAYPEPHRGVVCALTAAGLDAGTQTELTVGAVTADGGAVTIGAGSVAVHPDAAVFLRAQTDLRRVQGADDDAPLLATATGTALSAKTLATVLTAAARDLGVALVNGQVLRSDSDATSWLRRRGVSVTPLVADDAQRAKARTARQARRTAASGSTR